MDEFWYEAVPGQELRQGDLLENCPFVALSPDADLNAIRTNSATQDFVATPVFWNAVVLTQSCDLVSEAGRAAKVDAVLLCPFLPLQDCTSILPLSARQSEKSLRSFYEQIRRGNQPNFHMMAALPSLDAPANLLIVDFRRVFTCPLPLTQRIAQEQAPRYRLRSPYVEHLSQAFARFFMRVGLPSDLPPFR